MLDKAKIRLMARLAIYDRTFGVIDRRKNNYYKWDYIYFRNFWTRLGVFFGCMIITLFYVLKLILIEQADVFELNLKQEATKIGFYTLLALVVYTIIGTMVANSEYKKSKQRLDAYFSMLAMLDRYGEQEGYGGQDGDEKNYPHEGGARAGMHGEEYYEDEEYGLPERPGEYYGVMSRTAYAEPEEPPPDYPASEPDRRTFSYDAEPGEEKGIDILKRLKGDKQ